MPAKAGIHVFPAPTAMIEQTSGTAPFPPKPMAAGLIISAIALALNVSTLDIHFNSEMTHISLSCQQPLGPILWPIILLQLFIPAILLYKLARGLLWARNILASLVVIVQIALIYGAFNGYLLKFYLVTNALLAFSTLTNFLPSSKTWLQQRTKILTPTIPKPWTIITGLATTTIGLILLVLLTFGEISTGTMFAMGDGGYYTQCPLLPWDRLALLSFWVSLRYQFAVPAALLLFGVASRRRWALWLYALLWSGLSAFAIHLAITLNEFDFLIAYVLIAIGVVEACGIFFFLPPSTRWFKAHAT